jgi:hypothetical protein
MEFVIYIQVNVYCAVDGRTFFASILRITDFELCISIGAKEKFASKRGDIFCDVRR